VPRCHVFDLVMSKTDLLYENKIVYFHRSMNSHTVSMWLQVLQQPEHCKLYSSARSTNLCGPNGKSGCEARHGSCCEDDGMTGREGKGDPAGRERNSA
jgi:hypothetical protein